MKKKNFYKDPKDGSEETAEATETAEQETGGEEGGGDDDE